MKKIFKSVVAIVLALTLVAGMNLALAATPEKEHLDYGSYVLLGDSIASGWSDVEDRETRFTRVEGSYGAYLADDLGLTDSYYPMACIGFRTIEMRYIFEEDYEGDKYLYYSIDKEKMDNIYAPAMIEAVKNAGLITLNVGGNDWGSYLGWHVFDIMDSFEDKNEEFLTQARAYLETAGVARDTVETLATIAQVAGCLPEFIEVLPVALNEGLTNYFTNWDYMIEDIYALNPDVTLVVIGMFDTSLQAETTAGGTLETTIEGLNIGQTISDIANIPMKEGTEKYGYILIEPTNIECEKQHPSAYGHRQIADLILEALPDAGFPMKDVDVTSKEYNIIAELYNKGIMAGVSESEFAPGANLTNAQLSAALKNITGVDNAAGDSGDAKRIGTALALVKATLSGGDFLKGINTVIFALRIIFNDGKLNFGDTLTRAEAASILYEYINL